MKPSESTQPVLKTKPDPFYIKKSLHKNSFCTVPTLQKKNLLNTPIPINLPYENLIQKYKDDILNDYTIKDEEGIYIKNKELTEKQNEKIKEILSQNSKETLKYDLSSLSLPISFFEPRTILERITDLFSFAPIILKKAGAINDKLESLKQVICFSLSSLYRSLHQLKPFNSVLGETYQCFWEDGTKMYLEHTSYKGSISHFYIKDYKSNLFNLGGYLDMQVNGMDNALINNYITIIPYGKITVNLPNNNQKICFQYPKIIIGNIINGERYVLFDGHMKFEDRENNLKCIIGFNRKIKELKEKRVHDFYGRIFKWENNNDNQKEFYEENCTENPFPTQDKKDIFSVITGSWLEEVKFDDKLYWNIKESNPPQIYPEKEKEVLPSDSRYREDRNWLKLSFDHPDYKNIYNDYSDKWKNAIEIQLDYERNMPKPGTRKIFLNDMNSWFSEFFIQNLRYDKTREGYIKYDFMGTINDSDRNLPRLFTPKQIKLDYNGNYENPVFQNDIFVINMDGADFNDVDYIIKGLKALKYYDEKILVIISSVMTWARTQPKYKKEEGEQQPEDEQEGEEEEKKEEEKKEEEEGEKEPESEEEEYIVEEDPEENKEEEEKKEEEEGEVKEEPKKILYFKEKDYIKRIPSEKFYHNKMIETLALSNTNPMLKTYIICSGFIYGCGEDLFYDYFKMSWLETPRKLPIIGKGKNTIPTIHIIDLVSLIKRVIENKPKNKYIFAIDHTKNRQLKNIIKSIAKGVGTGEVENTEDKKKIPKFDELSIDLKAKPTKLFLDEKRDDEEDEAFEKRQFKWHCEFGIPENIEKLRREFNDYRKLKSVKIMITGPPASGKTYIGEKLSKYFNIPHILINDIIKWGKTLTDELGEEIKTKSEEIENNVKEAVEAYQKRPNRKKTDLPIDTSQISKLPEETVVKLVRRKLMQNLCRNRGYVLDGYPKGYKNAFNVFFEDTDESKAPEDPDKYKLLIEIIPNSIIRIDNCNKELLYNRMKKLPDINNDPNIIQRRLNRRINTYNELNESKKGEPSLSDFYKENKIEILSVDGNKGEGEIIEECKVFVERNGKILNYQMFDNEIEKQEKYKVNSKVAKHSEVVNKEFIENEFYDNEKEKVKEDFNKSKLSDLEKKEKEMLEKKSEVLRRYLAENVIPVLSKGILHVCQTLPEDPVDSLATYLFDNAFNAKFPPHKYKDQQ